MGETHDATHKRIEREKALVLEYIQAHPKSNGAEIAKGTGLSYEKARHRAAYLRYDGLVKFTYSQHRGREWEAIREGAEDGE